VISSRSLDDLLPYVQWKAKTFLARCEEAGHDVIIISTYRDVEAQNVLYAQGRTTPGQIVTRAMGGSSFHQYRVAFDFAPVFHGKIPWKNIPLFTEIGEIGEKCGLEWAGHWKRSREYDHLQYTASLKLKDFKVGFSLNDDGIILRPGGVK